MENEKQIRLAPRGSTEIRTELEKIKEFFPPESKIYIVACALLYGYFSNRTTIFLDDYLIHIDQIERICREVADIWDGQDYIAGALYEANRLYKKPLTYKL